MAWKQQGLPSGVIHTSPTQGSTKLLCGKVVQPGSRWRNHFGEVQNSFFVCRKRRTESEIEGASCGGDATWQLFLHIYSHIKEKCQSYFVIFGVWNFDEVTSFPTGGSLILCTHSLKSSHKIEKLGKPVVSTDHVENETKSKSRPIKMNGEDTVNRAQLYSIKSIQPIGLLLNSVIVS